MAPTETELPPSSIIFATAADTAAEAAGGSGAPSNAPGRLLYTPEDERHLTAHMCLTRAQIEAFAATEDDIAARVEKGGSRKEFGVGRVGIRCVHCAHLPVRLRAKGAVSYPPSIMLMNQAVRNWQRYHFGRCGDMPADVKEKYHALQGLGVHSKKTSGDYWVESCKRMGMLDVDTDTQKGIRFRAEWTAARTNESDEGRKSTCGDEKSPRTEERIQLSSDAADCEASSAEGPDAWSSYGSVDYECFANDLVELLDFSDPNPNAGALDMVTGDPKKNDSTSGQESESGDVKEQPQQSSEVLDYEASPADGRGSLAEDDIEAFGWIHNESANNSAGSSAAAVATNEPKEKSSFLEPSSLFGVSSEGATGSSNAMPMSMPSNRENMRNRVMQGNYNLTESVRIALDLAKKVREDHDRGVPHFCDTDGSNLSEDQISIDLFNLGRTFYKLFSGREPFGGPVEDSNSFGEATTAFIPVAESASTRKKREIISNGRSYVPLRELGFPVSLCIMVCSLIGTTYSNASDVYESIGQVEEDLQLMVTNPDRYLHDGSAEKLTGKLTSTQGRLYGRETHISKLMSVFDRMTRPDGGKEMVLVSGYSGTGKSVLAEQVRKPLHEKNGFFVSGKFDELGQVQPSSVIFTAFNEFCGEILHGDKEVFVRMSQAIKCTLGRNCYVLTDLMPNLAQLVGNTPCASDPSYAVSLGGGKNAFKRMVYHFKLFVRVIASQSHPVVLFFDDLQWADESSLEMLTMLISDAQMSSLLFVGCYRDNEVGTDHPLHAAIGDIALAGIGIISIKLDNIDNDSINALVSDTLHLSPRLTRSLSDIIYNKTSGNPLFAVQFLRSLYDEHLLVYAASSRRWEWDAEAIQAKDIADNVVDLMKMKISKLGVGDQYLLKVAACLGSRSEMTTLELLNYGGANDWAGMIPFFDTIVHEGFMFKTGAFIKFSHDQIQQAAYSLIPESEREAMHLSIGRVLWEKASEEHRSRIIFIVVDQLHRGCALITEHDEKVKVARLFLMAGEQAMGTSTFLPASIYLLQGCLLLDESDWEHHYDLNLQLFTCCAEAHCAIGDHEGVVLASKPVLAHGRSLQDKLRAHNGVLNSLGVQGKLMDEITYGLDLLAQLGESFPKEADQNVVMKNYTNLQAKLSETNTDAILHKPAMQDTSKVAVMKLLVTLSRSSYQTNQGLLALIVFRMVDLTLCYGVCRETSVAMATFGLVRCCVFGDVEQGHRYGKLAMRLLKRFPADECLPRVSVCVYGFVNIFKEPLQASLPALKHGFEIGMSTGDLYWGAGCGNMFCLIATQSGTKLDKLTEEMREVARKMQEYKLQNNVPLFALVCLQATLNLTGISEDPAVLTGDAIDQEQFLNMITEKRLHNQTRSFYYLRLWLAYLFGQYSVAAEMVECLQNMDKSFKGQTTVNETFYGGLTAIAVARREGQESEWRSVANDAVEKMKVWVTHSTWNFQHKLDLLSAEMACLNGNLDEAAKKYDDAIRVAGEHGFIHERGLACERAGMFHSESGGVPLIASAYFQRAHKYYLEWGAKRKAADLLENTFE